ncbi:outer membrane protein [Terrarubrum flagellatum]|uniref:outer membrane protein n=1 Tax=Terrirubrum flagellatum TaxID=2895980 RepID=UPI003145109C
MKKLLLASAALVAISSAAFAADLPSRKGPPPAPVYVPAFSWTGFYVGLQGGYSWGRVTGTSTTAPGGLFLGSYGYDANGGLFGAHAGYNYQFTPNLVAGIEGDIEWADLKKTGIASTGLLAERTKLDWQGSVRGRFGFALDRALIYATGGVAFADISHNVTTIPGGVSVLNYSDTRAGWTLGGGIEYALTNNITVRGEYRYTDYGRISASNLVTGVADSKKFTTNAIRAGVSYKF